MLAPNAVCWHLLATILSRPSAPYSGAIPAVPPAAVHTVADHNSVMDASRARTNPVGHVQRSLRTQPRSAPAQAQLLIPTLLTAPCSAQFVSIGTLIGRRYCPRTYHNGASHRNGRQLTDVRFLFAVSPLMGISSWPRSQNKAYDRRGLGFLFAVSPPMEIGS